MKLLQRIVEIVSSAMVAVAVLTVAAGVFWRFVLQSSLTYSFELSTLLYAYIIFLGINLALHDDSLIGVDILTVRLPAGTQRAVVVLTDVIMLAIAVIMTWYGILLVMATRAELSALRIPMRVLYACLPVGFGVFSLNILFKLARDVRALRSGREEETC